MNRNIQKVLNGESEGVIIQCDCLEIMADMPDGGIDAILCDLPYGITNCKWDTVIPFDLLWEQYKQITKLNSAIVLTGNQPFTSALIMSNIEMFKYCWVWEKTKAAGFLNVKKRPLNGYEDIVVFYSRQPTYHPQMTKTTQPYRQRRFRKKGRIECYGELKDSQYLKDSGYRLPRRIIKISNSNTNNIFHPTQKPVELMEYLILTYTNPGDLILDNCCGSGTTCVAAKKTGRRYIGIELEEKYCRIARARVARQEKPLFI